jgi:hypothetical protein
VDWQLTMTLAIVFLASCYLVQRAWRLRHAKKTACGDHCACPSVGSTAAPKETIVPISLEKLRGRDPGKPAH